MSVVFYTHKGLHYIRKIYVFVLVSSVLESLSPSWFL